MKPQNVIDMSRTGDLGGTKHNMRIDENSLAHVMGLLTDVYSDREMAALREIATNALDAQIEAGYTGPIQVTLPNSMNPYLVIQDFGVGMNEQTIADVFSAYGASTKRDSDAYNGVLGIGGKAPLTYASEFTVVGIKDGIKTTVVVSRVEDGTGVMEVVATTPTSDPNGTKVSIPTKPGNSFASKAAHLFSFWPEGTVLVNGQAPARVGLGQKVADGVYLVPNLDNDIVVMGNVPYPVTEGYRLSPTNVHAVAFVDMGEVNFPPSREALSYTARTKATLDRILNEVTGNLRQVVQDDVDSRTSKVEAARCLIQWTQTAGTSVCQGVTYNGGAIPREIEIPKGTVFERGSYRQTLWTSGEQKMMLSSFLGGRYLLIKNHNGIQISSTYKNKIKQYAASIGMSLTTAYIIADDYSNEWVDQSRIVDWSQIKAVVLPSNGTGGSGYRKAPTIDIYNSSGRVETTSVDKTKTLVYLSPRDRVDARRIVQFYKAFPNAQVVSLGANRWDKFKRENPGAVELREFVRKAYKDAADALTDLDKKILGANSDPYTSGESDVKWLDPARVNDPVLRENISIAKGEGKSASVDKYAAMVELHSALGLGYVGRSFNAPRLSENYPLLSNQRTGTLAAEQTYTYINACYAASTN